MVLRTESDRGGEVYFVAAWLPALAVCPSAPYFPAPPRLHRVLLPHLFLSITAVVAPDSASHTGVSGADSSEVGLVSLLKKGPKADSDAPAAEAVNVTGIDDEHYVEVETPKNSDTQPTSTAVSPEKPHGGEDAACAGAPDPTTAEVDAERSAAWAASVDDVAPSVEPTPEPEPDDCDVASPVEALQPPATNPAAAPAAEPPAVPAVPASDAAAPSPAHDPGPGPSSPTGTHLTFEELMGDISSSDDDGDLDEPPPMDDIGIDSDSDGSDGSDYSEPPPMMLAVRWA